MDKLISGVKVLLVSLLFIVLAPLPVFSFWYGEQSLGDMGYYPTTCEELSTAASTINRALRGFDNNPLNEEGIIQSSPGEYYDGVVLLSCIGGCTHPDEPGKIFNAMLIDMAGNFINGWDDINVNPAKLLPDGFVMGGRGAGFGGTHVVQQDWCGEEVWNWEVVEGTWHHDHNRQTSPNGVFTPAGGAAKEEGKTLVLSNHVPGNEYYYPRAWVPEGHPPRDTSHISMYNLIDDAIYIVDKKGRIKWQWFASDHIDQMGFSEKGLDGIYTVNVGRGGSTDWTHFNNVNWLGPNQFCPDEDGGSCDPRFHPDNLIFDSRTSGMIGIISHETGDIVWKIGADWSVVDEDVGPIIGPHNAHIINEGLPGAGNVLVFDNGGASGYGAQDYGDVTDCAGTYPSTMRDYSRILEINPLTYEVVWEYKCNPDYDSCTDRKFFSTFISSVQRLPNGNTQITEGNMARVFEVTPDNRIVWEYYAPAAPGGPGVIGRALYRAYRYPWSYVVDHTCD